MRPFAYFDTSALVKRFVQEAKTIQVENFLMGDTHRCVLSSLSITEMKSVLSRRQREAHITEKVAQQSLQQVMRELAQGSWHYQRIEEPLFAYAGELIGQLTTVLGALDALHLACAKTANCTLMVSADKQLLRASSESGLQILDVS